MSSIFNVGSGPDYSSLFGTTSSASSTSGSGNMLTEWASLKNGSYKKIATAYYGKHAAEEVDEEETKKNIKANTSLKSDTTDLKSAVASLQSVSLYEKKEMKDASGDIKSDYDYDKITDNLKKFVESYNSVIDAADDSDNKGVLRNAAAMTRATAANKNLLADIGITIGENNKLKLDETKVKEAKISDIKTLFQGGGSYGSQIESGSTELINKLNAENNKLNSYNAKGTYSATAASGNIYDGTY